MSQLMPPGAVAAENPDLAASVSTDGYVRDQLVLVFCDGPVYFNHAGQTDWKRAAQRQVFIDGDGIRTGSRGYAVLSWSTDNLLMLKPGSGVRFNVRPAGSTPRLRVRCMGRRSSRRREIPRASRSKADTAMSRCAMAKQRSCRMKRTISCESSGDRPITAPLERSSRPP